MVNRWDFGPSSYLGESGEFDDLGESGGSDDVQNLVDTTYTWWICWCGDTGEFYKLGNFGEDGS